MATIVITNHAAAKMVARLISLTQVERCVQAPEVVYGNAHGEIRQRGDIACGVCVEGERVIVRTVLLRHQTRWTDEQARARQEVQA